MPLSGHTTVAGIIGQPVDHSRSPAIHNAAYAAVGLDWVYVAFPVPAGAVAAALHGLAALGVAGVNVTMPHKADAAAHCDTLTPTAATLGVANTVAVRDGRLVGDSTDGSGFLDAAADADVDLPGASMRRPRRGRRGPGDRPRARPDRRSSSSSPPAGSTPRPTRPRLAPAATATGLDEVDRRGRPRRRWS